MREVTIEGLPERATLNDKIKVDNRMYTLGEFAMDSTEARKQDDGEQSPYHRIVTPRYIKRETKR